MTSGSAAGTRLTARVAARTAHDLNNIAAVFSGHIYLLRGGAESLEEAFEAMEKALEHMERLTRSLSALGTLGLDAPEPIDVNAAIRAAVSDSSPAGMVLELDPGLPSVPSARSDLTRAVTALVRNAREASLGAVPIRIATRRCEAGQIEIVVEDKGKGVSPDVRKRDFDPLFSTKGEKGRGIGITLVRAFAAFQGGSLSLDDLPGGGTCARLRLPATADQL